MNQKIFQVPVFECDHLGVVRYSIVDGNVNESFRILPKTGEIYINKPLDFETTPSYSLIVQATDGTSNATTQVHIYNKNVVGNLTIFDQFNVNATIPEESLLNGGKEAFFKSTFFVDNNCVHGCYFCRVYNSCTSL